jgi:hypothetical protein
MCLSRTSSPLQIADIIVSFENAGKPEIADDR